MQQVPTFLRGLLSHFDCSCTRTVQSLCSTSISGSVLSRQSECASASSAAFSQVLSRSNAAQLHNTVVGRYMSTQTARSASHVFRDQGRPRMLQSATQSAWDCGGTRQLRGLSTASQQAGSMCRAHVAQRWHSRVDMRPCSGLLPFRRSMVTQPRGPAFAQKGRLQKRASEQGLYLVAMVVGMIGLTYASVPLYRMFCQATGFGGTVKEGRSVEEKMRMREENRDEAVEAAAAERMITVSFNADVSDGMPWCFVPAQRSVKVHPGQSTLVFYTAHNLSDKAITGVSTYNVAPQQAGYYFNKIQCFCFEEQKLRPGEKIDMPVFFYIDPEFATDDRLKSINHLTLSYTFFNVDEEEVDLDGEVVLASSLIGRERASTAQTAAAG